MKKILFLIGLFLFPLFVYAADETIFSINEVTASPGNNVKINFNINNKQKFGVLTARVKYDKGKVTYVSHKLTGLKNGILRGADNNAEKGFVVFYGITLSDKKLMDDNGDILTVEFTINNDVKDDIPLTIEIVDFGIDENQSLKYKTQDGIIHIKSDVSNAKKEDNQKANEDINEELKKKDIKKEDITITSSDEDVASVTEDGNIEFKTDGNVTIEAKDKDGNIVYSKDYLVNNKEKKSNNTLIIAISVIVVVMALLLIFVGRKKWRRKK